MLYDVVLMKTQHKRALQQRANAETPPLLPPEAAAMKQNMLVRAKRGAHHNCYQRVWLIPSESKDHVVLCIRTKKRSEEPLIFI